jgi:hypothetical protein
MQTETVKTLLARQFSGCFATLGYCVEKCPDALWNAPVARYPFSQVAFHTLIFADLYLGPDAQSLRGQPFHLANPAFFGDYEQLKDREPVSVYERPQILIYLAFCRGKATSTIAAETAETLSAPAKFHWRSFSRTEIHDFSRAELHVNNIRHIQHHAAQLILKLRLDSDVQIPWIGTGS